MVVFDDNSAVDLPSVPNNNKATAVEHKTVHSVSAQNDPVTETGNIFVVNSSSGGKNTDHSLNECMLNIIIRGTGARGLFMLSDMGPLNYNLALTILLAVFLTTVGFYDIVIVGFLQRHSKQICDRMWVLCG